MSIQGSLKFSVKNDGPDGTRVLAFAKVDVKLVQEDEAALATFESLCIKVFENKLQEFRDGRHWIVSPDGSKIGKLAVLAGGYNPEVQFVTWGRTASFSQGYWKMKNMIDEAWVVIWPEHVGTRHIMTGVNFQQLAGEFHRLTGRTLDFSAAPFNSLYFSKALNCGSGVVELHNAVADDDHVTSEAQAVAPIQYNDALDGTWIVEHKVEHLSCPSHMSPTLNGKCAKAAQFRHDQLDSSSRSEDRAQCFWVVEVIT